MSRRDPSTRTYATALSLGHVRQHQEDEVFVDPDRGVFGVLDGMGGQRTGSWAVELARSSLEESMARWGDHEPVVEGLELALFEASERVGYDEHDSYPSWVASVTLAAFRGAWCVAVTVGDTRAFAFRDGELVSLTRHDGLLLDYCSIHRLSAAEIDDFPHKNIIVNALGARYDPRPHVAAWHLRPGDRVLLCSDGLSDWVSDPDIAAILSAEHTAEDAAQALLGACLETEASDNVSLVVVDPVSPQGDLFATATPRDPWGDLRSALHTPGVDGWFRAAELLDAARGSADWDDMYAYVADSVRKWPAERARPTPLRWLLDVWRDVEARQELSLCDTVYLPMGWAPPDAQWLELLTRAELLGLPRLDPDWAKVNLNTMDTFRDYAVFYAPGWVAQIDAELSDRQERWDKKVGR